MGVTTSGAQSSASEGPYAVRRYEPDDRRGVLELDEAVWNRRRSAEWFAWKYEHNPYLSEPPVFVAERDGEIVGARPLMAFRVRVGGSAVLALQPSDTMVHPDHRGRGLFTRTTERAIETYVDREPSLLFNFPNRQALPGYRKLGWRAVGARTTYYRIQNPRKLLTTYEDERLGRFLGWTADLAVGGYNRIRGLFADAATDLDVVRTDGVPERLLASLYRRRIPDRIHAIRDEQFYRWRFASPEWRCSTYVAAGGEPVAAAIVRTRTNEEGVRITQIADVVPQEGDDRWLAAMGRVFEALLDDHWESDLLAVSELPLPHGFLAARGFRRNDRPPLSYAKSHHRTVVVRPLNRVEPRFWRRNGVPLTERSEWLLTFAERDTA